MDSSSSSGDDYSGNLGKSCSIVLILQLIGSEDTTPKVPKSKTQGIYSARVYYLLDKIWYMYMQVYRICSKSHINDIKRCVCVCVYPSLCAYNIIYIHACSVALREETGEVAGYVHVHM